MDNHISDEFIKRFGDDNYSYELGNHVVVSSPQNLIRDLTILKNEMDFIMLLDVCGVDNQSRSEDGSRFESVYHLLNMENHHRVRVKVPAESEQEIPTSSKLFNVANWYERESWDMFGINYQSINKERLLTHDDFIGHPLCKDYDYNNPQKLSQSREIKFESTSSNSEQNSREWINIGPLHPSTKGTMRIMAEMDGERIRNSKLEIGYFHRCFEKICENRTYEQIIPYVDRLNYYSAGLNCIGWCKAVEDLLEVDIPDRAKALRMVLAELSRVSDHLICIANNARDIGTTTNFWFCIEAREKINTIFEKLCGSRLGFSMSCIGGINYDLPLGWISKCLDIVNSVKKDMVEIDKLLTKNKIWMERTQICSMSAADAIEWGYTGPCLRASGVNYDIRKNRPYYFYDDVEFEIPLGINGDCYDRYLVRMEEIRQSLKIVTQILDYLPAGDIRLENIDYSKIDNKEIYSFTEGANGELGFYLIPSKNSNKPYRLKLRSPCFPIYQSFNKVVKDQLLSDAIATLGSMNVVSGELDR